MYTSVAGNIKLIRPTDKAEDLAGKFSQSRRFVLAWQQLRLRTCIQKL
jgi:hypothetical protein